MVSWLFNVASMAHFIFKDELYVWTALRDLFGHQIFYELLMALFHI